MRAERVNTTPPGADSPPLAATKIYGYERAVAWESSHYGEMHATISPPGSTVIPYENSPMATPSAIGNPAAFLLFASEYGLSSPQACCIYALDTLNLPWALQEEAALAILSPTRSNASMEALEQCWGATMRRNREEFHGDIVQFIDAFALAMVGELCSGVPQERLATWMQWEKTVRPFNFFSLGTRMAMAELFPALEFTGAMRAPEVDDYGVILTRFMEIPVKHRLREEGGSPLQLGQYITPITDCSPDLLRSIINEHENFSLNLLEERAALVEEYNVEWVNAAWQPPGASTLLRDMRQLIAES